MGEPIRILISSCLLGEKVRYDGGHKREGSLVETLGRFVEWVPVCPEVDCGLPTPREAMRLVGNPSAPRLVTSRGGIDHTERMLTWSRKKLEELAPLGLCGYVCKKDSPSSGMERVMVYGDAGVPAKVGAGVFTKAFMDYFPLIPVEEEGRLNAPVLREMFIGKVFTLRRFRDLLAQGKTRGGLVAFHTDHKLLLLSHDRKGYTEMGRLVAAAKELTPSVLYDRYQGLLMEALSAKPTVKKSADVLLHMMGHFKKVLTADEKQELLEVIARYREKLIPLVVPVTLIAHHVRRHRVSYLERQVFLHPHPVERMLRNQV
ncbi:MAG: YbgA family protein [Candidatus Deferrimicrobiaceae bacterium]